MSSKEKIIDYVGFGHINIVVDNIKEAIEYYQRVLQAVPVQCFNKFENVGFSKAAGFLNEPEKVSLTICFLEIADANITLELMEYHNPIGENLIKPLSVNDIFGVRHVALKIINIEKAFNHIKEQKDLRLINSSSDYRPYKIDKITKDEFYFFDKDLEGNLEEKENVCKIIDKTKYFYFVDKYGVQWEFEEGHSDIGN